MSLKISIVLPVYNVEKYLDQCIESIVNQEYKDLEIIIIDDGSTDNSMKICKKWAELDDRILFFHKENEGLGLTRNFGLKHVSGDYVIFVDSDDWFDSDYIKNLAAITKKEDCDVVVSSYKLVKQDGTYIRHFKMLKLGVFENQDILDNLLLLTIAAPLDNPHDETLPHGADKLYRVKMLTENNLKFDSEREALGEDILFNTRVYGYCKKVVVCDEDGYNYRMNLKSISNSYSRERCIRGEEFYKRLRNTIDSYGLLQDGIHLVERSYLGKCRVAIRLVLNSQQTIHWKNRELDYILNCDATRVCINSFPINSYKFSLRVVSYCIKYKLKLALHILFGLRNLRKKNDI